LEGVPQTEVKNIHWGWGGAPKNFGNFVVVKGRGPHVPKNK